MLFDFDRALFLWLLPLAILPLMRRATDSQVFPTLAWIPPDRRGRVLDWLWRSIAVITMASIVIGLAGPGASGGKLSRTGRGAEVLIMLDRSSSMDAVPRAVVTDGSGTTAGKRTSGDSKSKVARELLANFVGQRPNERFSLMTFSTKPMLVAAFADQNEPVLSGLAATGIGRGLPKTELGGALLASISEFEPRSYSGSRVILIVSDGGAKLDEKTRNSIRKGLNQHRISVYFIYIRSTGSPADLHAAAMSEAAISSPEKLSEEVALHQFFMSLTSPYSLFQAHDSKSMADALTEIDRQQNSPLIYFERIPRQDYSGILFVAALVAGTFLLMSKAFTLRSWQ